MNKRLTYLEEEIQFDTNGERIPDIWVQHVVDIPIEQYEATLEMLVERGNKLHTGFDPETGEEVSVPAEDVEPEPTDSEVLGGLVDLLCIQYGLEA